MLVTVLTRRLSPIMAWITFPVLASLVGGFGGNAAAFIGHGIQNVAPVAAMFVFAILHFGMMTDAGMLHPIIDGIRRVVGLSPRAFLRAQREAKRLGLDQKEKSAAVFALRAE